MKWPLNCTDGKSLNATKTGIKRTFDGNTRIIRKIFIDLFIEIMLMLKILV